MPEQYTRLVSWRCEFHSMRARIVSNVSPMYSEGGGAFLVTRPWYYTYVAITCCTRITKLDHGVTERVVKFSTIQYRSSAYIIYIHAEVHYLFIDKTNKHLLYLGWRQRSTGTGQLIIATNDFLCLNEKKKLSDNIHYRCQRQITDADAYGDTDITSRNLSHSAEKVLQREMQRKIKKKHWIQRKKNTIPRGVRLVKEYR